MSNYFPDIYVIGYYGHNNIGDEQYLNTFDYIFKKFLPNYINYKITYLDCDLVKDRQFSDSDIIVLGGGDILNNYFIDQIIYKFKTKMNKIIAISVGIPYTDILVNTNKLNIIDYIFVRTQQDLTLFKEFFNPNQIFFIPDISYFMLNLSKSIESISNTQKQLQLISQTKKIIAISLSRHIYDKDKLKSYYEIIHTFSKLVKYLLTFGFHVVFLPFNTNESNSSYENDILIHNDVIKTLNDNPNLLKNITNITEILSSQQTLDLYDFFYATVPMRFHATLFSIYKNIPMLPVFSTRKIKNLLLDTNWVHGYQLDCDSDDIPIMIDELILINRFRNIIKLHDTLKDKLIIVNRDMKMDTIYTFIELITQTYKKTAYDNEINRTDALILNTKSKLNNIVIRNGYTSLSNIKDSDLQSLLVQTASYYLTNGNINSEFNYGIQSKMFESKFNYKNEFKYIIDECNKKNLSKKIFSNPYGLFNINYIDQIDYSGVHRSGWQYVYESIKYLHNDQSDLYLDLYLDRTFHWNKNINKELNLIPYTRNWIGFVHHTFDTSFSEYNNYNLLTNPDFIESLKVCKGIFVLSNDLKIKFDREFNKLNIKVNVFYIVHPTEILVPKFTFSQFLTNNDKKLVHIGGWLRNVFSFYNLTIPKTYLFSILKYKSISETIRKVALKGSYMDNYYPNENFTKNIQSFLLNLDYPQQKYQLKRDSLNSDNSSQYANSNASVKSFDIIPNNISQNVCQNNISQNISQNNISQNICQNNISQNVCQNDLLTLQNICKNPHSSSKQYTNDLHNNWYKHYLEHTKLLNSSVDFIEKLSNDDYDKLLTENIVFINLVDASAVNTVIECIIRDTPIIINNHPAVVELLGENYPLYFNSNYNSYFEMNTEIVNLLKDTNNIKKAYTYLKGLDKSKFNIDTFKSNFINILKTI